MNVLVLRNTNTSIPEILRKQGDHVIEFSGPIDVRFLQVNMVEFIVSYGYRHIIKPSIITFLPNRIVNLHISLLPWNRGADPNLWSFLEDTPKGVTIHYVDEGIDTGDILDQREVMFSEQGETLATTYHRLQNEIISLFIEIWPEVRKLQYLGQKQEGAGSFHKLSDKKKYDHLLTDGWNTTISVLIGKGLKNG